MKIIVKIINAGLPVKKYECLALDKVSMVKVKSLISQTKNWESLDRVIYNGYQVDIYENESYKTYCFEEYIPENFNSFLYEMKTLNKEES